MKWLIYLAILLSIGAVVVSLIVLVREGVRDPGDVTVAAAPSAPIASGPEPDEFPDFTDPRIRVRPGRDWLARHRVDGELEEILNARVEEMIALHAPAYAERTAALDRVYRWASLPGFTQVQALYREDPSASDRSLPSAGSTRFLDAHPLPQGTTDVLLVERLVARRWEPVEGWQVEGPLVYVPVAEEHGGARVPLAGVSEGSVLRVTVNLEEDDPAPVASAAPPEAAPR